ncbi:CU044_2847 family protein [Nonomuraea typhae]|uniref:CU044_2847 family protein n=1 Tax=Nonomuraea typhae TaxID=2603600 RepID=UPI0012FC01A5|nr:CU044_2847 family protein [Nonomuraea typhae]
MLIVRSDPSRTSPELNGLRPIYVEVEQAVEVDPAQIYAEVEVRAEPARRVVTMARDVFGEGVELARSCAARVAEGLSDLGAAVRPDEFELQVAIKLDSEVGAVVAKAGAGAQLQVTMRWNLQDR